ncbi:uncharacterized protein LOC123555274 [Mercenaria mercenaria]|uniref:uncharacterized protein LOC123555274 n=1 Tax=Mercenaria mercenaria TaxID=6596 RepID=UPI00234F5C89|nr:uncharacterized protein LOC123555274 [Mercenaria mercenaria]
MLHTHEYAPNVSLRVSEVLSDIGLSENMVLKRRKAVLFREKVDNIAGLLIELNASCYHFGSRSEGTTTLGLQSDSDNIFSVYGFNVIQNFSEWEPGIRNLLMIQDETVSPGYCLLQCLRNDAPLPCNHQPNNHYFIHRSRRIFLKNTTFHIKIGPDDVIHGPAISRPERPGFFASDTVFALKCKSWPVHARHWLERQYVSVWPSYDMKRYCSNTGCFVVGVGSKDSEYQDLEWRISTSLAERCLMFNLNITQMRCYVLMKMLLKTYIKPLFEDSISSFMCKTVLFHCVANTHYDDWREDNLIKCLTLCLLAIYKCVSDGNCPHFIIPENNLMKGLSLETKPYILEILKCLSSNPLRALLGITCDDLGVALQIKLNGELQRQSFPSCTDVFISRQLLRGTAVTIDINQTAFLTRIDNIYNIPEVLQKLLQYLFILKHLHNVSDIISKKACRLLTSSICTTLGSVLASINIYDNDNISVEAVSCIQIGLNFDDTSSKLKAASMFYCVGDIEKTELILRHIEERYNIWIVEPICKCYSGFKRKNRRTAFDERLFDQKEEDVHYLAAFCVRFLPFEINCVPKELRYEMFRSTREDRAYREEGADNWMNWAVVDSLSFLFFLQYKTFVRLGKYDERQGALSNLIWTIDNEPNLTHRETALNILGQCMEQENRLTDALNCYCCSLKIRDRNNAAKIHICRLLNSLINGS